MSCSEKPPKALSHGAGRDPVPLPKLDVVAGKRPHQEFEGYFPHAATPKEGMEEKEGQPITVLFEAVAVPSGDVRLMELQEKGWSYARP